jgi:hypothetical protein
MDPLKFEALVADYYRGQGYRVVECGTGGTKGRYDGGIDLKMYRDDEYIVVQCKRYTNSVVKHNDVHQLLGIMHTEGATRAIFINSGEYSRHALRKLQGIPNFQMIDGVQLREMIGSLPSDIEELDPPTDDPYREIIHGSRVEKQRRMAEQAADRLTDQRLTYNKTPRAQSAMFGPLLRIVVMMVFLWALHHWTQSRITASATPRQEVLQQAPSKAPIPAPMDQLPINGGQTGPTPIRSNALQPDERCINKQRFRRSPNGWDQIGSC